MKYIIILTIMLLTCSVLFSQSKKQAKKSAKPEIDRLAEKYKNTPTVKIYSSGIELECSVEVNYNIDNKPESIRITGESCDENELAFFLSQLISQKERQGYKSLVRWIPDKETVKSVVFGYDKDTFVLQKGNMIFKVSGGAREINTYQNLTFPHIYNELERNFTVYTFQIETIDMNRKGGRKATKFDI